MGLPGFFKEKSMEEKLLEFLSRGKEWHDLIAAKYPNIDWGRRWDEFRIKPPTHLFETDKAEDKKSKNPGKKEEQ